MRRIRLLCATALLAAGACTPAPEPPRILPELVLDIADPVVEAIVAGTVLRLRVDFDRRNTVEIGPAAAARLAVPFEPGGGALVGRVPVNERNATADVTIGGVTTGLTLSAFDRNCCVGADGAIGPNLLPYERVRFVRAGAAAAAAAAAERRYPLVDDAETGLAVKEATPAGTILVRFSLGYPGTLATAAAGAILAQGYGGRLVGEGFEVAPAFGVDRPARTIRLDRPATLTGFVVREVPVRIGDFRGNNALPTEPVQPGEIVASRRGPRPQAAWPSLLIGRDRIDRCSEILFRKSPLEIALRCADGTE